MRENGGAVPEREGGEADAMTAVGAAMAAGMTETEGDLGEGMTEATIVLAVVEMTGEVMVVQAMTLEEGMDIKAMAEGMATR